MGLFSSAASDLKAAQTAKAEAEAAVAGLAEQRVALLEQDGDPVAKVAEIDRQIATRLDKSSIYASRILALEGKLKRQHQASREEAKKRWLAEIGTRFDRVVAAAEKIDRDMELLGTSCAEFVAIEREVLNLPCHDFLPRDNTILQYLKVAQKADMQAVIKFASREFKFTAEAIRMRKLLLEVLEETPIPEEPESVEAA